MTSEFDSKVSILKETVKAHRSNEGMKDQIVKDLFSFIERSFTNAVKDLAETLFGKVTDLIEQKSKVTEAQLDKVLEREQIIIPDSFSVSNPQDIAKHIEIPSEITLKNPEAVAKAIDFPKRLSISNLKDIDIPKNEPFPEAVANKILKQLDVYEMCPNQIDFDRSRSGLVQGITELYDDFKVVTTFKRDADEQITRVVREVYQ